MNKYLLSSFRFVLALAICGSSLGLIHAQSKARARKPAAKKQDKGVAVIRGQIAYDKKLVESWDGNKLVIPFEEIQAKIRQRVVPPLPKYPASFAKLNQKEKLEWELAFIKTTKGKKFLETRQKVIEEAHAFDVKFEKDGKFVIYDVPYGTYGIQGRSDKEIGGKKYAFEVYGEIPVVDGMDEIPLDRMRVEVTPLILRGEMAPPVAVNTHNNKVVLNLKHVSFKDKIVFLNFWYSKSPTSAVEQKMIQDMYVGLKDKYPLKLVSICVDEKRDPALDFIRDKQLREGSHGFTDGFSHRTLFDYGVRSYPSFWLVGKDGKIMMNQYETAQAMRVKPDMKTIVEDRILGKDQPTPAKPPEADPSKKADAAKSATPTEAKKAG